MKLTSHPSELQQGQDQLRSLAPALTGRKRVFLA
jgi:hypothetical protein